MLQSAEFTPSQREKQKAGAHLGSRLPRHEALGVPNTIHLRTCACVSVCYTRPAAHTPCAGLQAKHRKARIPGRRRAHLRQARHQLPCGHVPHGALDVHCDVAPAPAPAPARHCDPSTSTSTGTLARPCSAAATGCCTGAAPWPRPVAWPRPRPWRQRPRGPERQRAAQLRGGRAAGPQRVLRAVTCGGGGGYIHDSLSSEGVGRNSSIEGGQ